MINFLLAIKNLSPRLFIIFMVGIMLSCQSSSNQPTSNIITLTDFNLCNNTYEVGKPITSTNIILSNVESIMVCGVLKTNVPIALSVNWSYNDELLFQDVKYNVNGHFKSILRPKHETFLSGNYEVRVYIGRSQVRTITFEVIK